MDLFYEVQGEGSPIVMLHSPGVDSREWRYVAPRLAAAHRVVTFDGRGVGKSPSPVEPADRVGDLLKLMEHLRIEKATLVGHSMGGQIATDFALMHPSKVEKLVLVAPSLSGFPYSAEFLGWIDKINAEAPDIDKMTDLSLTGPNYSLTMAGPQREFLREMTRDYMRKVFTEWQNFEMISPPPAADRLHELRTPTLVVQGDKEWDDMFRVAERFKEEAPDVRFALIEDSDHMVTLTHPEKLAELILSFAAEKTGA